MQWSCKLKLKNGTNKDQRKQWLGWAGLNNKIQLKQFSMKAIQWSVDVNSVLSCMHGLGYNTRLLDTSSHKMCILHNSKL